MRVLHIKFLLSDRGFKILEDNGMTEEQLIDEIRYMAKDHVLGLVDSIEGGMKEEIEEALKEEEAKKVKIKTL